MPLGYPADTPFGNLNLAEVELFYRIDYLNLRIESLYKDWQAHVLDLKGFVPPEVLWLRYQTEDIIYSLRKLTDTLIQMSYILGENDARGKFPKRIAVDCIGELLRKLKGSEQDVCAYLACYRTHIPFLILVNDISNTYKHHFVNAETVNIVPSAEPSAFT